MIEDPDDPRVADYRHLTDAALRQAYEAGAGVFIAEGHLVIAQLLRSPYRVRSFLCTPARLPALRAMVDDVGGVDVPVHVVAPELMGAVAGFDVHRGLLAAAERPPLPQVDDVLAGGAAVVAVLEGINDHENMGAIFRNAAAFSVTAVLLDPRCCDPLYRRSVRVSMGHVLRVPFTVAGEWPGVLADLRGRGFRVVALTPDRTAAPISIAGRDRPVALVLGSEGDGLSAAALAGADERVRIPIAADVDSLNVATAAAIAFSMFLRDGFSA